MKVNAATLEVANKQWDISKHSNMYTLNHQLYAPTQLKTLWGWAATNDSADPADFGQVSFDPAVSPEAWKVY